VLSDIENEVEGSGVLGSSANIDRIIKSEK